MKCYEVRLGVIKNGLPITKDAEQAAVPIKTSHSEDNSPERALLSQRLAEQLRSTTCGGLFEQSETRLLACDFERRSELWLEEERELKIETIRATGWS